jgi:acetyl-CoA carboxylase carboxyl transferase subunit beta
MGHELVDEGSWAPVEDGLATTDPISFPGYGDKAADHEASESVKAGPATIGRYEVEFASFDFSFFGGSMGEVAGERLAQAMDRAAERGVPFVLRTATGGARMQEGMKALVQMPKVVAARVGLGSARQPFICIFGNPTTGGVLASLGALADISVAEAGATIGFAGPRLVEHVTGHPLEEGSHTAEAALSNGLVDEVVEPEELQEHITTTLMVLASDQPREVAEPTWLSQPGSIDAWDAVQEARSSTRPLAHELLLDLADAFVALRGDRAGRDDPALDVALARIAGRRVLVMSLDRERLPGPGAYRKARRTLSIAERLGIPVLTLVDTRGAEPSEESEAGGIAWEIARLFEKMLCMSVPTVSIVTGEGGSGGALAFASTDVLLAFEGSIFSVIAPELAAQILWKDPTRAAEAARLLKLSSGDLQKLGIADGILPEPVSAASVRAAFAYHLDRSRNSDAGTLAQRRRERWRSS